MTKELAVLDKVLPVVVRVHGEEHPELEQIQVEYGKLKAALEAGKDAKESMGVIRQLTKNYTLPADACEAYTKVYNALEALDQEV